MRAYLLGDSVLVDHLTDQESLALRRTFTLDNPAYIGAVRSGHTPIGIDPFVRFWSWADKPAGGLRLPAAAVPAISEVAAPLSLTTHDLGLLPTPDFVDLRFRGALRWYQAAALAEALGRRQSVLQAPTGSGKTVMGCAAMVARGVPALVIVHTRLLVEQWVASIERFLGVTPSVIAGGHKETDSPVTVAIINSLADRVEGDGLETGHLIVDECHRAPSPRYWRTLERISRRYSLGLSATPWRRDGLDTPIFWALGQLVQVERQPLVDSGSILQARVRLRHTEFEPSVDMSAAYSAGIDELVADPERNALIVDDAMSLAQRSLVLTLSDRREHCSALARMINARWARQPPIAHVLVGGQRAAERRGFADAMDAGEVHVICATSQLVGEGFDLPQAGAAQLTTPVRWRGKLAQAVGRVLRPAPGQTYGEIYDYRDKGRVLVSSGRARDREYLRLGAPVSIDE